MGETLLLSLPPCLRSATQMSMCPSHRGCSLAAFSRVLFPTSQLGAEGLRPASLLPKRPVYLGLLFRNFLEISGSRLGLTAFQADCIWHFELYHLGSPSSSFSRIWLQPNSGNFPGLGEQSSLPLLAELVGREGWSAPESQDSIMRERSNRG